MFIKKVVQFDVDAMEAEVIISNGTHEVLCYCHPVVELNKKIEYLASLYTENIVISDEKTYLIEKLNDGYFSYHLQGKVISENMVSIGEIVTELDSPLPVDIMKHDYVNFCVTRLNCIFES